LFGQNIVAEQIYRVIYCLCTVIGASASLGNVIDFTDAAFLSMAIPNVLGLFLLSPVVRAELQDYIKRHSL